MPDLPKLLLSISLLASSYAYSPPVLQAGNSIIPEISEEGRRGEIARKQRSKSAGNFLSADSDGNQRISLAEAQARLPYIGGNFARFDRDGNGELTWQEFVGHDKWPEPDPAKDAPASPTSAAPAAPAASSAPP